MIICATTRRISGCAVHRCAQFWRSACRRRIAAQLARIFPEAGIVGLDIEQRCKNFEGPGVKVEIVDQSDVVQLVNTAVAHGPFDLIIDDGSHFWSHQILTFETLLPFLRPGGLYILEDIFTSFGSHTEFYGKPGATSAAQYIGRLANHILAHTVINLNDEADLRTRKFVQMIDSITYIRGAALVRLK